MGNVCTCCNWRRGVPSSNPGKPKKLDNTDPWFEQDSVPLMSARYGLDDIGFDDADGSLKRTVLIRSPRPARTTTSDMDDLSSRTSRRLQQQYEQEERGHIHRVKSASVDSSSYHRRSPRRSNRGDDEERPRSYSENRHRRSHQDDAETRPRHERRTVRSSSLEVQDSIREIQPSSPSVRSPRVTSQSQDAASFADDEVDSVEYSHGSPRSHRSSSNASSSPKASSRSGSPSKKARYGRKHYRANASRK